MAEDTAPGQVELESAADQLKLHVEGRRAANEAKRKEAEEAEKNSGIVSVEGGLVDEAKFVGNPDDLRKDVDSEEKFSEDLEDGDEDLGLPEPEAPAKKATAKKTAAKK